jgi:crotonobetainyl-CoA:carnitine CoA-transferase CaiB-like acyl-CoA transferase
VAERLGFDHLRAKAINPRIVFSHLTAYGSTGPLARWPGSDQMAQALCGLEYEQGASAAGGHPTWLRFGMTDAAAGLLSVVAILQALDERERTGVGQAVDTDIFRAGMLLASDAFVGPDRLARRPHLDREQTGFGPWHRLYETADGWLCVAATTAEQRDALARVVGTAPTAAELEVGFRARDAAGWWRELDAAGVPCEVARVRTDNWCDDPDLLANGWVASYEHPVWGHLEQPGPFVHLASTPGRIDAGPPLIGQHTDEILDELGYTTDEVGALRERGIVGG